MPVCSVIECCIRKTPNRPSLTIHRIPRNECKKKKWLEAIGMENIKPNVKDIYICSLHFDDKCFNKTLDVTRLRDDAVPFKFVRGCGARKSENRQCLSLHRLPRSVSTKKKWLEAIGIENIRQDIKDIFICSLHFEENWFNRTLDVVRLRDDAVPSQHLLPRATRPSQSCSAILADSEDYVSSDHAYNRQRHEDHNYSKTPFSATNESPAEKRLSDDEDKIGNSKKNQSCSGQDHPANNCGFKSSIDPGSNKTRGEPNNFEDGIDLNSLDGFDEPPTEAIFSWQKEDILYPADDTDVLMCPEPAKGDQLRQLLEDVSLYEDKPTQPSQTHEKTRERADAEYQCNVCEKEIIGFRYTCVQCADFDLCGACEANGAHNTHYVLRVPKDRPYNEIQTVLAAIRQQLLAENLFLTEQMIEDSVKSEPEEEPGEGVERGWEHAPAQAEPDPLRRPTPDLAREAPAPIRSDDEYSDGSVYRPPRRKRRRRRSLNTNSDTDSDTDSSDTTHTDTPHYKARTKPATRSALNPVHGTQLVTHPKVGQPDVFEISGAVYQLPDDIFAVPGTVFEVPGNIYEVPASMAADGILEVPDNITVFRQEPSKVITERIYVEEDVVQDNFDTDNRILHLRVPPNTDDAALAQALYSQASVALQPLVIRTMKR